MTRFVPVTVLVVLAASRMASAQTGMLPEGAQLTFANLYIHENGGDFKEPSDPDARRYYFNRAHCVCSKANAGNEKTFQYLLKLDKTMTKTIPAELWVGTQCEDNANRNTMCKQLSEPQLSDINTVAQRETRLEFSLYDVISQKSGGDCPLDEGKVKPIFLLADTDGANGIDYALVKNIGQPPGDTAAGVDTNPPPPPIELGAEPAERGILLSWTVPVSRGTDINAYQALCATPDGTPVRSDPPKARYVTTTKLCNIADAALGEAAIESAGAMDVDVTAASLPDGLKTLDPAFICGEQITGTANRLSIDGLQNGVPYTVVLVATDLYGNFAGSFFTRTITPQPATDFWEDLHDRGSEVEGGFCASTRSPAGSGAWISMLGVIATAWWVRRRTPRRRSHALRVGGIAIVAVIALSARGAYAGGYQPYWENDDDSGEQAVASDDPSLVTWHAGIRLGPYYPDIDKQFGTQPGPYKQMFGGYRMTPMLDVDRILWTSFGQLGVGVSLGYMQVSAHPFTDGSDPNDSMRPRSAGDDNTFRLIPTALTATYRFTYLDDMYGIPVVPYVRAGLSYYIWWLSADGDRVCKAGQMPPMCDRNKPYGGTLGYQGSIGLSLRAERIDPATAMSMQQSGIQHAGIYAELFLANVDGFGSATKLSVGDRTWFAGFDFEF